MNEKIKTGGPAFPLMGMDYRNGHHVQAVFQNGMSLRDYFAPKAMHSLINSFEYRDADDYEFLSHYSYKMADAMLAERERGE